MKLAVFLCATMLASASMPALGQRSVVPESRPYEPWWVKRYETLNDRIRTDGKDAKIVFIGDSITELWEREGKKVWEEHYQKCGAINLGIGSDQTQHVLWRLDHMTRIDLEPKLIVLLIGTNNIPYISGQGHTVQQAAAGVNAVISKLKSLFPKSRILVMGILPRGENPERMRGEAYQINQLTRRLSKDPQVRWIDVGDRFVKDDGTIPVDLMYDGLHLTEAGYRIWANAISHQVAATGACR